MFYVQQVLDSVPQLQTDGKMENKPGGERKRELEIQDAHSLEGSEDPKVSPSLFFVNGAAGVWLKVPHPSNKDRRSKINLQLRLCDSFIT